MACWLRRVASIRRERGEIAAGEYAKEIAFVREKIGMMGAPHWQAFLAAWQAA